MGGRLVKPGDLWSWVQGPGEMWELGLSVSMINGICVRELNLTNVEDWYVWIDHQGPARFTIIFLKDEVWREMILELEVLQMNEFGGVMSVGGWDRVQAAEANVRGQGIRKDVIMEINTEPRFSCLLFKRQ